MKRIVNIGFAYMLIMFVSSCALDETPSSVAGFSNTLCYDRAFQAGYIYRYEGVTYLRAGLIDDEEITFNISDWTLKPCQLNLGLGREAIQALIDPAYVQLSEVADDYLPDDEVLILNAGEGSKVYPLKTLTQHELINDVVDGNPVMVHYSLLADLAVVYQRRYCDTLFTFGVSGYTYWDYDIQEATNSFLLWDRETESLWWPLINKAVSGEMQGNWLVRYDETLWYRSTWSDVLENYPNTLVLEADQSMDIPVNWPRYFEVNCK